MKDSEQALDWLVKGDIVKMDANKVLIDHDHEDEIPDDDDRPSKFRYSVINAAVGYVAKCVHKADAHKPYVGRSCYLTSAVYNFFTTSSENYGVIVGQHDGSIIDLPDEMSFLLVIMNGKYGGGGMPFAPLALLNDGLLDVVLHHGPAKMKELPSFIKRCLV